MPTTADATPSTIVAFTPKKRFGLVPLCLVFFVSGIPALLYQIVWQRALFTIYGVNIESVTIIVTIFMLGLGLGSITGGWLSKRPALPLLAIFGGIELSIGAFGLASLKIFKAVAGSTAGGSAFQTGAMTFLLVLLPTLLMGGTLPLLVTYVVRLNGNVGESVGLLYSVNAFGSAAACFLAAHFLMRDLGESGCVRLAAIMNVCVAIGAFIFNARNPARSGDAAVLRGRTQPLLSFPAVLLLAAVIGFISLGYEIIWYRMYSFVEGRSASCFATLLGWYLAGIAYGSLVVRDLCRTRLRTNSSDLLAALTTTVIWANVAAYLVGPALAVTVTYNVIVPFVFFGAALLGAAFPLLSHASIGADEPNSGAKLSYLYLSNILGCALGSFTVGFVLLDYLSTAATSFGLFALGMVLASVLLFARSAPVLTWRRSLSMACALTIVFVSWPLHSSIYERMLFKDRYVANLKFKHLIETRSGVVAVTDDDVVYGGGVYDGSVSVDLVNDRNGIFRVFALDAFHSNPTEVLLVGLSSGSWAQVIASNPRVAKLTIVEINPGYLNLLKKYPEVASLLHNRKVQIVIDDGRRWLARNPQRTFDAIVMNTSQNWLAHASNLLSVEFLQIVRRHLKPGGIHYYNTTYSREACVTGASVFPYAFRIANFMVVSDSPIIFDKQHWRSALSEYRINGKHVFDLGLDQNRIRLTETVRLVDTLHDDDPTKGIRIESGESMRKRFGPLQVITDDNMGNEWK